MRLMDIEVGGELYYARGTAWSRRPGTGVKAVVVSNPWDGDVIVDLYYPTGVVRETVPSGVLRGPYQETLERVTANAAKDPSTAGMVEALGHAQRLGLDASWVTINGKDAVAFPPAVAGQLLRALDACLAEAAS